MRRFVAFLLFPLLPILMLACRHAAVAPAAPVPAPVAALAEAAPAPAAPRARVLDTPLWTQTIAVLDTKIELTAPDGFTEDLTLPITEQVEAAFLATGRFELVERARLEVAHTEMNTTTDPLWFDQSTVAKLGQGFGARFILLPSVRVTVGVFATRMDLKVKVMDTATGSLVQSFTVHTSSASSSINSSVTACLSRLQLSLQEAIAPYYPAQAVIVHSPAPGVFWAEAKQILRFSPGTSVRVLRNEAVFNPVTGTTAPFTTEVGRGRVQSLSPQGLVVTSNVKAEDGWLIEILH